MKEATIKKNIKSIRDNFSNGSVGDFLVDHIENNSNLSFVTAYFTIYAYEKLKPQLDSVNSLRLLFGEPRFIKSVASSTDAKNYQIEDDKFVKDNFKKTKVSIVDNNRNTLASATISIEVAVNKAKGKMTLDEYLSKMDFDIKNYA